MEQKQKQKQTPDAEAKKSRLFEIAMVAVILLLVGVLLIMGRRTVSVTLPASFEDSALWQEVANDGKVVRKTDEGFTTETEYTFKYKTTGRNGSVVIVFAYVDPNTGDEIGDRRAFRFDTNALGFVTAVAVDPPEEGTGAETTAPAESKPVSSEEDGVL